MTTKATTKYICECGQYKTNDKSNYRRHKTTKKHFTNLDIKNGCFTSLEKNKHKLSNLAFHIQKATNLPSDLISLIDEYSLISCVSCGYMSSSYEKNCYDITIRDYNDLRQTADFLYDYDHWTWN